MRFTCRTAFLFLLISAPCSLSAQAPEGPLLRHSVQFLDVRNRSTPNAPFSAVCVLDFEPAAATGQKPIHLEQKFYRNGAGLIHTEDNFGGGPTRFHLISPELNVRWLWNEGATEAIRYPRRTDARTQLPDTASLPDDAPRIDGIATQFTRASNPSQPDDVRSIWYSPELQLPLAVTVEDPSWGKASVRFTHIHRGEPDPTLFVLPSNLVVRSFDAPRSTATVTTSPEPAASPTVHSDEPQPAYASDPKFQKAYADAKAREAMSTFEREARWKKASKLSQGQCVECLHEVLRYQLLSGAYKDAITTADQLEQSATKAIDKLYARASAGEATMHLNFGHPGPEQLQQADRYFRSALQLAPRLNTALFEEGRVLAIMNRGAEAKEFFQKYVDNTSEGDKFHLRAEHFVDNPQLATMSMAPPFHLVTAQGEEIELDDMHGKVVLLDFWATWCGPCRQTLPDMQRIARDFKDEPLVVISISQDSDAQAWQQYVQQNHMDWPQFRDVNGALSRAYGVSAIPHFFTIDTNGVLQTEMVGSNADVRGRIKKLIKEAHATQAKSQFAQAHQPATHP